MNNLNKLTKYNEAVARGKELLSGALKNWIMLIQHLRGIENSELWKHGPNSSGWSHFGDFLRAEYPGALGYEKYRNCVQLIETDGVEFATIVGPDPAHLLTDALLMAHPKEREQLKATIIDQHTKTGVAPKVDVIRALKHRVLAHAVPQRLPARVASIEEARSLRIENGALKRAGKKSETLEAEVKRLRAENTKLKAEIKALRSKLRSKAA